MLAAGCDDGFLDVFALICAVLGATHTYKRKTGRLIIKRLNYSISQCLAYDSYVSWSRGKVGRGVGVVVWVSGSLPAVGRALVRLFIGRELLPRL